MSDEKKPWAVRVLPGALDDVPEADRDAREADIRARFAAEPPGSPADRSVAVVPIAPGTRVCPVCRARLKRGARLTAVNLQVLDCSACGGVFSEPLA